MHVRTASGPLLYNLLTNKEELFSMQDIGGKSLPIVFAIGM
jgi:hypothetical protein